MSSNLALVSAELYDILPNELHPLHGGHFSQVYGFSREGHEYILRISPIDEDIDLGSTRSILDWMSFLSAHGGSAATPLTSRRGYLVEQLEEEGQSYILTAFEKARGILAEELPFDRWDEALFQSLGQVAGRMHAIAKSYSPPQSLPRRPEWDQLSNCYHYRGSLEGASPLIRKRSEQVRQAVRALPREPAAYGLIHGDLHCANFFVDAGHHLITLFDFDDCCYGWYAMDVAMSLFDMLVLYPGGDKAAFTSRFLESYLKGYLPENPLDNFWINQLPLFLKLLEVEIYAMLVNDYQPGDSGTWGDRFMANRAKRIESEAPYVDVDFLEIHHKVMAGPPSSVMKR